MIKAQPDTTEIKGWGYVCKLITYDHWSGVTVVVGVCFSRVRRRMTDDEYKWEVWSGES